MVLLTKIGKISAGIWKHRNNEIDTMETYKIAGKQGISRFGQSDLLDFGANCGNIETAPLDILHLFLTIAGNR